MADILLFIRVADTLSFKDAARHLGISRSQASKRIATLEARLATTLIYRSSRRLSLTNAGETLLEHYRPIYEKMEEARRALEHLTSTPSGRLRFSVPTCLGAALVPTLYDAFRARYPQLVLDAHLSEECVDIVGGGYDIAIRVARRLSDSNLTAQRLATSPLVLAASPEYLDAHGVPGHAEELAEHACLGLGGASQHDAVWEFRDGERELAVPVSFAATTDTNLALVVAACAGLGFVYVPKAVIANELRHGMLRAVLPQFCDGIEWGVYAVYAARSPTSNAAALIEFLREFLPALETIDRWKPLRARSSAECTDHEPREAVNATLAYAGGRA